MKLAVSRDRLQEKFVARPAFVSGRVVCGRGPGRAAIIPGGALFPKLPDTRARRGASSRFRRQTAKEIPR